MLYQFVSPEENRAWERVRALAKECIKASQKERPEVRRLKLLYEERRRQYALSKADMDTLLYRRMYGKLPSGPSSTLKIRYWRTGHHIPVNRDTALSFARALDVPSEDCSWFLTAWLDKSRDYYPQEPLLGAPVYWERRARLDFLISGYLRRMSEQPPPHLKELCLSEGNSPGSFRHLYYVDALQYICQEPSSAFWKKHIYSMRYDPELKRSLKLLGEVPRKTMIRHLILLGLPNLSISFINEQLSFLGYLPLTQEHTLTGGEYLDRLLLGILTAYSYIEQRSGSQSAALWFLHSYQKLDAFFVKTGQSGFRFMYFKSLE